MKICASRLPRLALAVGLVCLGLMRFAGQAFGSWQLSWSDEFTNSAINTNYWTFDIGNGSGGWGNNELEYYTSLPQNAYISNGVLHIVALQQSYMGFNYTSAKMKTLGLFSQKYGRFEFYAKLPQGQGCWPALWLMPEDEVYGGWAASGEIDIMENKGSVPTNVLGTIHFGGMYPDQTQSYGPSYSFPAGDSVTNFHLYALEWFSNSISWYVDSNLYETQTSWWSSSNPTNTNIRNPYPAPFDQSFYIIMNLAIGGNFGGNPDDTTVFPGDMQVQYVRAYNYVAPPFVPPVLKLQFALNDPSGSTSSPSTTNSGGVNASLQMVNGSGVAADYHGALGSGVAGAVNGNRALDFTSNGTNQPGNPGPCAAVTNSQLGFGVVSNFTVSFWFKQHALMAQGGNLGPRLFVMGGGAPSDTGVANSLGMKFQTSTQIYFQLDTTTISLNYTTNLPTNEWLFFAAVYDGTNATIYQGSDTESASYVTNVAVSATVNFGASGSLFLGNHQNLQRSFNGWMDDFRFYTGAANGSFVESIRKSAANPIPPMIALQPTGGGLKLSWTNGALQTVTNLSGPWQTVTGAASPYYISPTNWQQFYRLKIQ